MNSQENSSTITSLSAAAEKLKQKIESKTLNVDYLVSCLNTSFDRIKRQVRSMTISSEAVAQIASFNSSLRNFASQVQYGLSSNCTEAVLVFFEKQFVILLFQPHFQLLSVALEIATFFSTQVDDAATVALFNKLMFLFDNIDTCKIDKKTLYYLVYNISAVFGILLRNNYNALRDKVEVQLRQTSPKDLSRSLRVVEFLPSEFFQSNNCTLSNVLGSIVETTNATFASYFTDPQPKKLILLAGYAKLIDKFTFTGFYEDSKGVFFNNIGDLFSHLKENIKCICVDGVNANVLKPFFSCLLKKPNTTEDEAFSAYFVVFQMVEENRNFLSLLALVVDLLRKNIQSEEVFKEVLN